MTDPWKEINPSKINIRLRRVKHETPHDIYWALFPLGEPGLVLDLKHKLTSVLKMPNLKTLFLTIDDTKDNYDSLQITLQDSSQKDLFYKLCIDIIETTKTVAGDATAVERTVSQIQLWQKLFQEDNSGLSKIQQKGLIAELLFLDRYLLADFESHEAVSMWHGPMRTPRDFSNGQTSVEVKSKRGSESPEIIISSENQLATGLDESLFIYVLELNESYSEVPGSFSLDTVVKNSRDLLKGDAQLLDLFESRLCLAGFSDNHDYSSSLWSEGAELFYEVSETFPRITSQILPEGVCKVSYNISLNACSKQKTTADTVLTSLQGTHED